MQQTQAFSSWTDPIFCTASSAFVGLMWLCI